MNRYRWYITRTDQDGTVWYYRGAGTWSRDIYDRYFWYISRPVNHPVLRIYTGCEIHEESYRP
jgi:hypothetical protein